MVEKHVGGEDGDLFTCSVCGDRFQGILNRQICESEVFDGGMCLGDLAFRWLLQLGKSVTRPAREHTESKKRRELLHKWDNTKTYRVGSGRVA